MREIEKNLQPLFYSEMKKLIHELVLMTQHLENKREYLIAVKNNKLCIIEEEDYYMEFDENDEFVDNSDVGIFSLSNNIIYSPSYSLIDIANREYEIFSSLDDRYCDFQASKIENSLRK